MLLCSRLLPCSRLRRRLLVSTRMPLASVALCVEDGAAAEVSLTTLTEMLTFCGRGAGAAPGASSERLKL